MKTLSKKQIINEIKKIHGGTLFRLGYITEVPIKAEFKDVISITKVTETTVRTGVNYSHIKTVKERLSNRESSEPKTNNFTWVIKNKIRHNSNTDKDYLWCAHFNKGNHSNSYYIYSNKETNLMCDGSNIEEFKEYIRPSYFTKQSSDKSVFNIALENIFRVRNVRADYSYLDACN